MQIVILTSSLTAFAAIHLPDLADDSAVEVVPVIVSEGGLTQPWRLRWKKIQKVV